MSITKLEFPAQDQLVTMTSQPHSKYSGNRFLPTRSKVKTRIQNTPRSLLRHPFFCKGSMKCINCVFIRHMAAQCRKHSGGWDAKRIVDNKIRHCNAENGQRDLFELVEEVVELCGEVHFFDNPCVMFGSLLIDNDSDMPNDDHRPQETDGSFKQQKDDPSDIFECLMPEADGRNIPQNASSPENIGFNFCGNHFLGLCALSLPLKHLVALSMTPVVGK